jgi:hypothetical protein
MLVRPVAKHCPFVVQFNAFIKTGTSQRSVGHQAFI